MKKEPFCEALFCFPGLVYLCPVVLELLDALVRQRVLEHLLEDGVGDGRDIRACLRAFHDVFRRADAGGDDLGLDAVDVEDLRDLRHEAGAVVRDVVHAADEGADVGGSCPRCEQRLVGREDQRDVRLDPFLREDADRLDAFFGHRDLDCDHVVDLHQFVRFGDHAFGVVGEDFRADGRDIARRGVGDLGDLLHHGFELPAFLRDQAGVRRDPGQDAPGRGFADLVCVCCVDEYLHVLSPFSGAVFC